MYKEFETKTSYNYLREVIKSLNEPVCILGGWAVFFHVNEKYENALGRPYLGSRDIDLGFNNGMGLKQTIKILKEKLKFKPLSFRLVKEIHTETEEEIKDGEIVPAHFIFPMYVDLIVDDISEDFKKEYGFNPIDEPLLRNVFEENEHNIMKEFGRNLLVPKPEILLAMKVNSLPDRDKGHKRVKDICDIFALAWYTGLSVEGISLAKYLSKQKIQKCLKTIADDDFEKAASQIGHEAEEIKRVITVICGK